MKNASEWMVVIVESPFSGDMEGNRAYAIRACADCVKRGEVPYASHLFFPQFLNELAPEERELGLTAGYAFWKIASKIVFYCDRGISGGMARARERAQTIGIPHEERFLDCVGVDEYGEPHSVTHLSSKGSST
jgi:hypothetical protein